MNQRRPINTLAGHRECLSCAFLLVLALIFLAESARAQAIFGSVRAGGGVPMEGVLVRATRTSPFQRVTTSTDSSGGYVLGAGLSGTYQVEAVEPGYTFTPAATNVTISGSSIRVDFTTPATLPTVMAHTATNVTERTAMLRGFARPNGATTRVWFEYGLTTAYGNISGSYGIGSDTNLGFSLVFTTVSNLANGATYHFRLVASNSFGVRLGADVSFDTLPGIPSVITLAPTQITATAARLNGSVNPTGSTSRAWFEFGTTTNYGTVTAGQNVGSGNAFVNFNQLVALAPGTTYHYRAVGSNVFGVTYGADTNFTTLSGIPSVITFPPSQLGANTARLNGRVNPNGANATAWFDLGTTTNYGDVAVGQNLGSGTVFTNYNQMLIGLIPGTTYHYRAAAATSFGTNYGTNVYFTPLFTDSGATNVPYAGYGSLAWGDYDNDGRLDVVASPLSGVWRNTGGGFVLNTNAGLPYAADGSVAWGDYDSDGWLDILLTGWTWPITTTGVARVYHNNRDGTFTDIHAGLPKIHRSSAVWGDYDNDGRQDILLAGLNVNTNPITQVWRNTGFGFALDTNVMLPGISHGAVAWGDYDNDGRLDILLAGSTTGRNPYEPPHESIAQVWRNTGNGFTDINAGLPGASGWNNHSAVAWGDYDNDRRLDILLAGTTNGTFSGVVCQVWRNTGNGFVLNTNAALTGVADCSVAWGDYDNDGWLDVLLSGYRRTDFVPITEVWRNTGSGFFNINAGLAGVADGGAVWGDFDSDGRLDILAAAFVGYLWRNNIPTMNTPPGAPSGLMFSFANSAMTLSWNAATDTETPAAGLSYNIRIGTTPGGSDVFSAMASTSGWRRVSQFGNAQQRLSTTLNLPSSSTPYYWTVQAVDGAFAGSPFATESTFKLLSVLVPVTSTNTVPGDLNGDGIVDQTELNIVLSNYWPHSPWIEMTNTAGLGTTNVQFALTNATGWNFSVEVSTNLMNWDFLGPAFPFYQFSDPAATNDPQRYYRLRWP